MNQVQRASSSYAEKPETEQVQLVTMRVNGQLLGIPVSYVRDVLKEGRIAQVPLASAEICGSMNLRGRIVTVVDVRTRLKMPVADVQTQPMFVVVENKGEYFSLKVDSVGDVLTIPTIQIEKSPSNIESSWREISTGVHRLNKELLVIVDISELLNLHNNKEVKG